MKTACISYLVSALFALLAFAPDVFAQSGAPLVQSYAAADLNESIADQHQKALESLGEALPAPVKVGARMYGAAADKRGFLYFANEAGVLEYDGARWRVYAMPDSGAALAVASGPAGQIFVGGKNDFGVMEADSAGLLTFKSLCSQGFKDEKFGEIRRIAVMGERVYFIAENYAFTRDQYGEMRQVAFLKNEEISAVENLAFVPGWGVVAFEEANARPALKAVPERIRKALTFTNVAPFDEGRVMIASESSLSIFDGEDFKRFRTSPEVDQYFRKNLISDILRLPDGKLVVGTRYGGFVWLGKDGGVEHIVDRNSGLAGQQVNSFALDAQGGLWVCTSAGLSRADMLWPVTRFQTSSEFQGAVQDVYYANKTLYVGTTMGLYYLNVNVQKFRPVDNILAATWSLQAIGRDLYAATSAGVYRVKGDTAIAISGEPARSLAMHPQERDALYVGLFNGLGKISAEKLEDKKNRKRRSKKKKDDEAIDTTVGDYYVETVIVAPEKAQALTVLRDDLGRIEQMAFKRWGKMAWIYTEKNGLQEVYLTETGDSVRFVLTAGPDRGLPAGPVRILNTSYETSQHGAIFSTSKGLYYFDNETRKYAPFEWAEAEPWMRAGVEYFYEDGAGDYLVFTKDKKIGYGRKGEGENAGVEWALRPFSRVQEVLINDVFSPRRSPAQWIGSETSGMLYYDPAQETPAAKFKTYATVVRGVTARNREGLIRVFEGAALDELGALQTAQDSGAQARARELLDLDLMRFEFAAPFFDAPEKTRYSYRLRKAYAEDAPWSAWRAEPFAEFYRNSLDVETEYVFEVRARNLYGEISETASFSFTNNPRFYQTDAALAAFIGAGALIFGALLWLGIRVRTRQLKERERVLEHKVAERTKELNAEKEKSEGLLLNILPQKVADELKEKGKAAAREYAFVSVLFTDFKGFTKVAEKLDAKELVDELNLCFSKFDDIVGENRLEKIKTIGDAYMCAGGIPVPNVTNPVDVVLAGLKIQEFMRKLKAEKGEDYWELRVGVHTGGPIIAGVVGKKKFAYDVWGDAVNTAARMESSGEPRKVNISGDTYEIVKDFFECSYRGKLPAKNKGEIDMYFVERIKPELSDDAAGLVPNDLFLRKLELFERDNKKKLKKASARTLPS